MNDDHPPTRTWLAKFSDAFRGVGFAVRGSSSFAVHCVAAIGVIAGGAYFHVSATEWCLLLICIATVMAAEAFNSAIETLAQAVDRNHNPDIGRALDIASAAVLIASIGAAITGAIIFATAMLPH